MNRKEKRKEKRMEWKGWEMSEMPPEVVKVCVIHMVGQPIGSKLMEECQETIKKYPQFFSKK
jgi:hypothetical protein